MEYFKDIDRIKFEGSSSYNPLAFRWYNKNQLVAGKSMAEHLRFSCAYWHSFGGNGSDPFGEATHVFGWNSIDDPLHRAQAKMDAAFEFMIKMGFEYYCFHDMDLIDFSDNLVENKRLLASIVEYAGAKQQESGVKLLWGTANLFSKRKFMNGAATNPDFSVLAHAGAQVKSAIDATITLGGAGYVFWGGREGYLSLLNTDMKREKEHLARFLTMARDYGRKAGFKGTFFIEPKPCEPTKHQYDYDAETVLGFLEKYDLSADFKLNLEVNHATLAGHSFQHELQVAADAGKLGSMDANRGDNQNGWDTDQFPNNLGEATEAMLIILKAGGFKDGGINFDAKIRRNSTDPHDLFYAHLGAMDLFARALVAADQILNHSDFNKLLKVRYSTFDDGDGKHFETGNLSLEDLEKIALNTAPLQPTSGRQEFIENLINRYLV